MQRKRLLCGIAAFLVGISVCKAEDVTVRVISAKNGHPIVEMRVQLYISDPPRPGEKWSGPMFNEWVYTDSSGSAIFHVGFPIPLDASLVVGGLVDYCSPATYHAAEVLQKGVSIADAKSCPHRSLKKLVVRPRPGEIVIFSGEYSRLERGLYFPWPG